MRDDGRSPDQLRPIAIKRNFIETAPGSVLLSWGKTKLVCTATVVDRVPQWLYGSGRGWLTAEYSMLPGSTAQRHMRQSASGKVDGRACEVQRLIGRSLRAVTDLSRWGEKSIYVDCDVLVADGGTRTAAITGGYVALVDALRWMQAQELLQDWPLQDSLAAVSVGVVKDEPLLDLCYTEDAGAEVDMNVVMTGHGEFIEIQGTAERSPFNDAELTRMLGLARKGIEELTALQEKALEPE